MAHIDELDTHAVGATTAGLSDVEVVRRVLGGERALFEVLMRRYNQRVFRAIRSVLRGHHESEDAMQQAWLSAYSHLGQFQGASSFSTWMTRIALNEALGRTGGKARTTPIDEVPEEDEGMRSKTQDPEGRAADRELGRMMEEAVDELPDLYRSVFVLRENRWDVHRRRGARPRRLRGGGEGSPPSGAPCAPGWALRPSGLGRSGSLHLSRLALRPDGRERHGPHPGRTTGRLSPGRPLGQYSPCHHPNADPLGAAGAILAEHDAPVEP